MWVFIIVLLFVLAVAAITWAILAQRKMAGQVQDCAVAKEALVAEDLSGRLAECRKISLTGQSLKDFAHWESEYQRLQDEYFVALDQAIEAVLAKTGGLNVLGTRKELQQVLALLQEAAQLQKEIKAGLSQLTQQHQYQHQAIDQLHADYEQVRNQVADGVLQYGPARAALLDFLAQEEADFQSYQELKEKGQGTEAAQIFEELGMEAGQVTHYMQAVPMLVADFNQKFLEQLQEILETWTSFVKKGIILSDEELWAHFEAVDQKRVNGLLALTELKIKEAQELDQQVNSDIQALYDLLENEYQAYHDYFSKQEGFRQYLDRVQEQNHSLLLEIEYLKANFTFQHDEEEEQQHYRSEIQQLLTAQQSLQQAITDKETTFRAARDQQENALSVLTQLDRDQVALHQQIAGFWPALKSARAVTEEHLNGIRDLQRSMERRDLPGLPQAFLDYFFAISDEVKRLDEAVHASRVDLDDIQRQISIVSADYDTLRERAETVLTQAELAVSLLQYASRYEEDNEAVQRAIKSARAAYQEQHDYAAAVQTMKEALQQVDPDAYGRLLANQADIEL
ncbi:septation ring formation regulator EzrA [Leuconostocaceae bacterium ESL0958]|nr:septation ring formation regulator EzrA [Leuconostocaceae bacterium ESL0958]